MPALLLWAGAAAAQQEPVHVKALRDPEAHSYKAMLAGLDAFDRHRAYAPAATALRFRVEPLISADPLGAAPVRIVGDDGFLIPLALDEANSFALPRSEAALQANADLVMERKSRDYRFTPLVITPGLPGHVRRLGDLRLECKVRVAIVKEQMGMMWRLSLNTMLGHIDWCERADENGTGFVFAVYSERPLAAATLREGERSRSLRVGGQRFRPPLNDRSWGDEALVELDYLPASTGTAGGTARTAP